MKQVQDWHPIPNYEGLYWINQEGQVCNKEGHILFQEPSKFGYKVELRKNGQRDKLLVADLLRLADVPTERD